jgi:hypothetical protein
MPISWIWQYEKKLSLYTFQDENGKQTLQDKFWTSSLVTNCFATKEFSCKLLKHIFN